MLLLFLLNAFICLTQRGLNWPWTLFECPCHVVFFFRERRKEAKCDGSEVRGWGGTAQVRFRPPPTNASNKIDREAASLPCSERKTAFFLILRDDRSSLSVGARARQLIIDLQPPAPLPLPLAPPLLIFYVLLNFFFLPQSNPFPFCPILQSN